MSLTGKRAALRFLVGSGIVLCLTPTLASCWVAWRIVFKPLIESGGKPPTPANQFELQTNMRKEPIVQVCVFGLAPVGVTILILGMIQLRKLNPPIAPPLPTLPNDYGLNRPRR